MARDSYRQLRDRVPSGCCSACGQTVPDNGLRVDLQTNTVSAGGQMIAVQPRTAEMIHVLLERSPHFVPREVIIAQVWSNNALDRSVDAQATRAKVALRKLGYVIESMRGSGYRIVRERAEPAPTMPALASFARLQYVRPY